MESCSRSDRERDTPHADSWSTRVTSVTWVITVSFHFTCDVRCDTVERPPPHSPHCTSSRPKAPDGRGPACSGWCGAPLRRSRPLATNSPSSQEREMRGACINVLCDGVWVYIRWAHLPICTGDPVSGSECVCLTTWTLVCWPTVSTPVLFLSLSLSVSLTLFLLMGVYILI